MCLESIVDGASPWVHGRRNEVYNMKDSDSCLVNARFVVLVQDPHTLQIGADLTGAVHTPVSVLGNDGAG
jgi:hypothetical protein